jgi:hypothetical protein
MPPLLIRRVKPNKDEGEQPREKEGCWLHSSGARHSASSMTNSFRERSNLIAKMLNSFLFPVDMTTSAPGH